MLDPWLAEGAQRLADVLRAAGPDANVWIPVPGVSPTPVFWARRFAHETVIHRADAALDALDEWMELGSLPMHFEVHPWMRELLGPDRTIHLHATDTAPQLAAEWLIDLTGDVIAWRRPDDTAREKATVAMHGPLTYLLLVVYKRRPVRSEGIEILGDGQLLDFWLERVSFG